MSLDIFVLFDLLLLSFNQLDEEESPFQHSSSGGQAVRRWRPDLTHVCLNLGRALVSP